MNRIANIPFEPLSRKESIVFHTAGFFCSGISISSVNTLSFESLPCFLVFLVVVFSGSGSGSGGLINLIGAARGIKRSAGKK